MVNENKKLLIGLIAITAFLYLVFSISISLGFGVHDDTCSLQVDCPHEQQLELIYGTLPLIISIAAIVGASIYYFMVGRIESKEKTIKDTSKIVLKFLNTPERQVVNKLIENNGKVLQSGITHMEGMTKLKCHRIIQKLADNGIIRKEQMGKTNIIRFTEEIEKGLL